LLIRGNRVIFVAATIASGIAVTFLVEGNHTLRSLLLLTGTATLMVMGDRFREIETRVDAAAPRGVAIDRHALCAEYFEKYKPRFAVTTTISALLFIAAWATIAVTEGRSASSREPTYPPATASFRVAAGRTFVRIRCRSACSYRVRAAAWTSSGKKIPLRTIAGNLPGRRGMVLEMRPRRGMPYARTDHVTGVVEIGPAKPRISIRWP
jgi:hypothetical protein